MRSPRHSLPCGKKRQRKKKIDEQVPRAGFRPVLSAVFDASGNAVYIPGNLAPSIADVPFRVKVSISDLNIRRGPGTDYAKIGKYTGKGVFTIVEVTPGKGSTDGWGRLKSGAGWISLDYCQRL